MSIHPVHDMRADLRAPPEFTPIPSRYGVYGWLTPYIAAMAASNPSFAARALSLPRGEQHFIALLLALMGNERDDDDHFAAFVRDYGSTSRKALLRDASLLGNVAAPPSLAAVAFRLAGRIWRPRAYLRLAALMQEPHARKTIGHMPSVSRRQVAILSRLPAGFRTRSVLRLIKRRRDLPEVLFAIEIVKRIRTDLTDRQILTSLAHADPTHIRGWVMRHYEHAPFPPAPRDAIRVDGVDILRPLASHDELARAAREFENCIRDDLWHILKGDAYFYRYAPKGGKGAAIVELRRVPVMGWVVHEALGPKNDPISASARLAIVAAFRAHGIGTAPQAQDPQAWFDIF